MEVIALAHLNGFSFDGAGGLQNLNIQKGYGFLEPPSLFEALQVEVGIYTLDSCDL